MGIEEADHVIRSPMRLSVCLFAILLLPVVQADELPFGVRSVLNLRDIPESAISIHVTDLETGEIILSHLDDVPRNPASTIKLYTTLVALDVLGPAYTWKTGLYARGEIKDGVLDGDLLLKGKGDPFLVTERVWQMLRELRRRGVREITGDLLIDDTYFDVADSDPAAFDRQPLRAYNVTPSAVLMNFKVVRFGFEPDDDGTGVRIQAEPPLDNLFIDNRLRIVRGHCRGFQRGISVDANSSVDRMIFSGSFPSGCKRYSMSRTALDHRRFAYGLVRSLWEELGGSIGGTLKQGVATEEEEPLFEFRSLPLSSVITRVNKYSNNVMARQLLYTLSAEDNEPPGTEQGGLKVIHDWLAARALKSEGFAMENGSGLSRASRLSAAEFGALLRYAWRQPYMPEFAASMAITGLDGTARRRLDDADIRGYAHLKTGSLDHVSAIAGYMQSASGRRFSVVMLQNYTDIQRGPGDEGHIALLKWLYEQ